MEKVPFDLKICKLEGIDWNRNNLKVLATQLYERQGKYRASFENRLFVCFDKSTTCSVAFQKLNEILILQKIIQVVENPLEYWFKITANSQEYLTCVILLSEGEYKQSPERNEHIIQLGLSEPDKAEFAHKILTHINWVTDGKIEPHPNTKLHGCDGFVYLPKEVI